MILVHVQHFLDEKGQEIFPQWLEEVTAVLRRYEGFIAVGQLIHVDDPTACHLWLEFESLPLLRQWGSSSEHDVYIDRLKPYRLQEHDSQIFEVRSRLT